MTETILTIMMPCLNEAETLAFCMHEAKQFIDESGIPAEILVVDNGSLDESVHIAKDAGARVVVEEKQGYGYAIRTGFMVAKGDYIIMGDCDGSYDFCNLMPYIEKLKAGYALVVGNRLSSKMEKGAMPFLHRYIGVPGLSWIARKRFGIDEVQDFHCGLRGVRKDAIQQFQFCTGGMEFATEMIVEFANAKERICEVPIVFRRDRRSGRSHLRTFRDGWRHLKYILEKRV